MLEQLFGSRTRSKILRLFYSNPQTSLYIREICRRLDEHMNSIRRELEHLEGLNLLRGEVKDRRKYYSVNTDFVLYPELRALVMKSQVMFQREFLNAIRRIGSVRLLVLTGIFAGMDDTLTDMLVVGQVNRKKLRRLLGILQQHVDQPIRYTVFSTREFLYRNDLTDRFIYHILENKKIVVIDRLPTPGQTVSERVNGNREEPENAKRKDSAA